MRPVLEWLFTVEDLAHRLYTRASQLTDLDPDLRTLLTDLAEDEAWHREVMAAALDACSRGTLPGAEVVVDSEIDDKVLGTFRRHLARLDKGLLTQDDVIRVLVTAELSEWNHLFLYAVRSLEQVELGIDAVDVRLQRHVQEVEQRLQGFPEGRRRLAALANLDHIWLPRVLIVEDREPLALLVQDFLAGECRPHVAFSGEQGLALLEDAYFNVVISDVRMPGMDGLEFYSRAAARFPNLGDRFLFMSGHAEDGQAERIRSLGIPLLAKPFRVAQLVGAVRERVAAIPTRPREAAAGGR